MNREIVAAGLAHSLVVMPEGDVYQFGNSGDRRPSREPACISGLPPITSVSAGSHFSLFVDHDGNVWGMGISHHGELGFIGQYTEPQQIKFEEDVKIKMAAASRNYYSVFLDEDGSVWTCGYNVYGQLGLGNFDNTSTPKKIENIPKMCSISAGNYHSMFLDVEGRVWGCGHNRDASLALGHTKDVNSVEMWQEKAKIRFISAGNYRTLLIDEGDVWYAGKGEETMPHKIKIEGSSWEGFVASQNLVVDTGGQVWVWGDNSEGQLGLGQSSMREDLPVVNNLLPPIIY